ncbi:MAG TPA: hypothetical protein VG297_15970 [Bryobacteraceae bacterium]|nr:hypothetical protein [Bryobacteraceae bacterium]
MLSPAERVPQPLWKAVGQSHDSPVSCLQDERGPALRPGVVKDLNEINAADVHKPGIPDIDG